MQRTWNSWTLSQAVKIRTFPMRLRDLWTRLAEGGRALHRSQKTAKRLGTEKEEELQAALEEAEAALEQEENKGSGLSWSSARSGRRSTNVTPGEGRRIENTRKCHQRAIDSMQASWRLGQGWLRHFA